MGKKKKVKDGISEKMANWLILLDLREARHESEKREVKSGIDLSVLVFLLKKKATCLHFCSQIVVISFVAFYMAYSLQLFHWDLLSEELFRRDLLILHRLCPKVEIKHSLKNVRLCLVHSQKV